MSILKLIPTGKDYLWGGTRLMTEYHKNFNGDKLAETWELSCHPDGPCTVANGPFANMTLAEVFENHPELMGKNCERFSEFPLLIKLIDAQGQLSIQVHPDDEYAMKNENQFGKTEMWYIVDCGEDSFIYYGFNRKVSKEEFEERIRNNTLLEVLNKVPVKKGESYFIEAGTIHAINSNILIAEVQQSSNVTYRVYDYGRKGADGKERQLHIDKAVDVTVTDCPKTDYDFDGHMARSNNFVVDKLNVSGIKTGLADQASFHSILILEGSGAVKCGEQSVEFNKGDSILITAGSGEYVIEGNCEALLTTVGKKLPTVKVGIDLGGTNVKIGIVDKDNNIIGKKSIKTYATRHYSEVIKDISDAVLALLKELELSVDDCISLGIGSPGTIDAKQGRVVYSNNFGWEHVPFVEEMHKYIDLPIKISNDANCAALGEVVAGAAKGCQNAVLFTLGTGVGGGIIIDGKVFEGGFPGGAEIGHATIISGGEMCTCGRPGCLEAYASATAIIRDTKKAMIENPDSMMYEICENDFDKVDGKTAFIAARAGDKAGTKVVKDYIFYLGEGITNIVNIFRPEKILLSGGICYEGAYLTDPLQEHVRKYAFAGERAFVPPIERAILGNDAGIIGSANL